MLKTFFIPKLIQKYGPDFTEHIFCQDGASCHTAKTTLNLLEQHFGDNIISNKIDNFWPPYSPDLNPCDFYLWGFLKDFVFKTSVSSIEEMKNKIISGCEQVSESTCKKVIDNFNFRVNYCATKRGKHFAHTMKKSSVLQTLNTNI